MKRKLLFLLSLVCVCCMALAFVGCGAPTPETPANDGTENIVNIGDLSIHVHTFSSWEITTSPSCTTTGSQKATCSCGHVETVSIPATGHNFGAWETTINPTCEKIGVEKRSCACGHFENRDISALGHSFGEWEETLAPSCEDFGAEKRVCACGYYEWRETPPTGHSFSALYTHDQDNHWHSATCGHDEKSDISKHSFILGICLCGQKEITTNGIKVDAYVDGELFTTLYTNKSKNYKIEAPVPESDDTGNINSESIFYGWFTDANYNTPLMDNTLFKKDGAIYGKWITANSNTFSYAIESGKLYITDILDKTAQAVVIPAYINSYPVYAVAEDVFEDNHYLKKIVVCDGVQVLDDYCFESCSMLEEVVLPESLNTIGSSAFANCVNLKTINLPSRLNKIYSSTFNNCQSLKEITIPETVEQIDSNAFYGTYSLETINYNAINCANLSSGVFNYVGKNTQNGTTVNIGKNVQYIPSYLFDNQNASSSSKITKIEFEKSSSLEMIGSYAFAYNTSLKKITIPNSVSSIGSYAFSHCSSLTEITLPSSLTTIATYCFSNCSALTKITIPSSVVYIERYAFSNCSLLTNVKFEKTSGWSYSSYSSSSSGSSFSSSQLANNATAATYLTSNYCSYYWRRG